MSVVVVCFDETVEKLVNRTAKSLLKDQQHDDSLEASVLPPVVEALIGTKQFFKIKSHTYYHFGDYESFNCAKVILPSDSFSCVPHLTDAESSFSKRPVTVYAPDKEPTTKRRKFCVQDSDSDEVEVVDVNIDTKPDSNPKKRISKVSKLDDDTNETNDDQDIGSQIE